MHRLPAHRLYMEHAMFGAQFREDAWSEANLVIAGIGIIGRVSKSLRRARKRLVAQSYAVALDPYGVGTIVDALDEFGTSGENRIIGISHSWKLTDAIKDGGTQISRWVDPAWRSRTDVVVVANARVETQGKAPFLLISKRRARPRSILSWPPSMPSP